jgi:hypothetical protein
MIDREKTRERAHQLWEAAGNPSVCLANCPCELNEYADSKTADGSARTIPIAPGKARTPAVEMLRRRALPCL